MQEVFRIWQTASSMMYIDINGPLSRNNIEAQVTSWLLESSLMAGVKVIIVPNPSMKLSESLVDRATCWTAGRNRLGIHLLNRVLDWRQYKTEKSSQRAPLGWLLITRQNSKIWHDRLGVSWDPTPVTNSTPEQIPTY